MSNFNTINDNAKLQLVSLRLSSNPDATVVKDEHGIDGKLNETSDGRKYYIASFRDPENPFGVERTRIFAQTTNSADEPVWKSGNPELIKKFVGKLVPGDIVTRQVDSYMVGDRAVDTYSCVVLKNESVTSVFKQQGHEIGGENNTLDVLEMIDAETSKTDDATEELNDVL